MSEVEVQQTGGKAMPKAVFVAILIPFALLATLVGIRAPAIR
jgi:hypothetical protein